MTYLLRKTRAQARIEGWESADWDENDYAVVDETRFGRIYLERIHGEMKWLWFLQTDPAPPPNQGIADTLVRQRRRWPSITRRSRRRNDRPQCEEVPPMTWPRLTAEQRLALAMLAGAGRNGATQVLLSAHGFDASMIAGLVSQGLATITAENVRADGKLVAVVQVRITEARRDALAGKSFLVAIAHL